MNYSSIQNIKILYSFKKKYIYKLENRLAELLKYNTALCTYNIAVLRQYTSNVDKYKMYLYSPPNRKEKLTRGSFFLLSTTLEQINFTLAYIYRI